MISGKILKGFGLEMLHALRYVIAKFNYIGVSGVFIQILKMRDTNIN